MNLRVHPAIPSGAAPLRTSGGRLIVLLTSVLLVACSQPAPEVAELAGETMGTSFSVKLSPAPDAAILASLKAQIEQRLEAINAQMSTYRSNSDLTRFNQAPDTDWQSQPVSVVALVEQANRISQLSGGRYDITVGPLVNLWGFGNSGSRSSPPSQQEIDQVLQGVGYRQLHTRRMPPGLRKETAQLQIDLSSIAKGWAVDQIATLLRAKGLTGFLVEIGGEVRAQGQKSSGRPWRIAIEQPSYDTREVRRVITLRDTAMATSGDYRNFFADAGQLYSHTIDPASGHPVQHRLASVTVLADDCATADAWATALLAMGDRHAPELADKLDLKVLFIIRSADGLSETPSRALSESGLLDATP